MDARLIAAWFGWFVLGYRGHCHQAIVASLQSIDPPAHLFDLLKDFQKLVLR